LSQAPAYAVAATAENLRKSGQFSKAYIAYKEGYQLYPNTPSIAIGYAVITAETRYPQDGQNLLDTFRKDNPNTSFIEVENAANYIVIIGGRGNTTIRTYDNSAMAELGRTSDVLAQMPENPDAMSGLVNALILLEASTMASAYLQDNPHAALEQEKKLNEAAYFHRYTTWARNAEDDNPEKHEAYTKALAGLDALLKDNVCINSPGCVNTVNSYKVVALSDTGKHQEALQLYENLAPDMEYSSDTSFAAARSYITLKQPEDAQQTYVSLIDSPKTPEADLFSAHEGLFWSYIDSYNFKKGREVATFLGKKYQIEINDCRSSFDRALVPPEYHLEEGENADILIGLSYLYSGERGCAETYFRNILDGAPSQESAITALAVTQDMRDLPRTAQESLRMAETAYVYDPYYDVLSYSFKMSNREWKKAKQDIEKLRAEQPNSVYLPTLEKRQRLRESFELIIGGNIGISQDDSVGASNQNEPSVELYFYSKPFLYNWRAFIGYRHARGEFEEGNAVHNRYMAGLEYSSSYFVGTATAALDDVGETKGTSTGFGIDGTFFLTDHWRVPVAAEINSDQTPLRARYSGVNADRLAAGVTYYVNDYRQFDLTGSYMDFDDNNERKEFGLAWSERLFTHNSHSLTGVLSGYASANNGGTEHPYYNPERDWGVEGALNYKGLVKAWPGWTTLIHNITVSGGPYNQSGEGTSFVYALGYSHEWEFDERVMVDYGYTFSSPVYDGNRENNHNIFLSLRLLF
jgi:biofilm PGA synthesis protein PgaA